MVVIIKTFKPFLLPPAINLLFALLGFLLLKRFPKTGKGLLIISFVSLYLFSISIVSTFLLSGLEDVTPLSQQATNNNEQAIVILAAGRYYNAPEYLSDTVDQWTLERLRYGAVVNKQTGLPVLVTGGRMEGDNLSAADLMERDLSESFGIQARWKESRSRNTAENAIYSAGLLRREKINHVYLVTHAWHMKRAVLMFEHTGLKVTPAPTAYGSSKPQRGLLQSLIPASSALLDSNLALHEYIGLLWYRLRYISTV